MKHAIEIKASDVTNNRDPKQRVRYLEHVVLKLHIDHHRRGDLEIKLKSPQGTPSILLERRMYDRSTKVCKGSNTAFLDNSVKVSSLSCLLL